MNYAATHVLITKSCKSGVDSGGCTVYEDKSAGPRQSHRASPDPSGSPIRIELKNYQETA